MTLRERLEALAGVMCDSGYGDGYDSKCLAIAAARTALEDLAKACQPTRAHTYASENADRYRGFDDGMMVAQRRILDAAEALK